MWIDSQCHVQWSTDGANAAIQRARDAGVRGMVVVGTDAQSSRDAITLAKSHAAVRATVGLHPHDASRFDEEWEELQRLAEDDAVVAVGETGFDLHYRHSEPEAQERAFRAQIQLAKQLDRALVIHSREAWDDTFRVLGDEGPPSRTVFHCFTGGSEEARRALDLGTSLSFSGIVSFPGAAEVRDAAAICPPERTLVETDSPYLTPVPHRGQENEPAYVRFVGEALAAATRRSVIDVASATSSAAEAMFGPIAAP